MVKLIERDIYPVIKNDSYIEILGQRKINLWHIRKSIGFVSNQVEERINQEMNATQIIQDAYFFFNDGPRPITIHG